MGVSDLILVGGMFVIVYFFMIRPQAKKAKEQENFIKELSKGDKIITGSGIHGRIMKIEENIVTLEVYKNTYINVEKSAVSKDLSDKLNVEKES